MRHYKRAYQWVCWTPRQRSVHYTRCTWFSSCLHSSVQEMANSQGDLLQNICKIISWRKTSALWPSLISAFFFLWTMFVLFSTVTRQLEGNQELHGIIFPLTFYQTLWSSVRIFINCNLVVILDTSLVWVLWAPSGLHGGTRVICNHFKNVLEVTSTEAVWAAECFFKQEANIGNWMWRTFSIGEARLNDLGVKNWNSPLCVCVCVALVIKELISF